MSALRHLPVIVISINEIEKLSNIDQGNGIAIPGDSFATIFVMELFF